MSRTLSRLTVTLAVTLLVGLGLQPPTSAAALPVTVSGASHAVDGVDVRRGADMLVRYTPARGATTGTNQYGFEAAVVDGVVVAIENGVGDIAIPRDGFVLSGHGEARRWLRTHALIGAPVTSAAPVPAPAWISINGLTHGIDGTDVPRRAQQLIRYTPRAGATTGANEYGVEVAVVAGRVTERERRVGDMAIPADGYVLSGHGQAASWLFANAVVGESVDLSATEPAATAAPLLPDVGVRTLRRFTIERAGATKMLKFPAVTANVGNGPMEIRASRSSVTADDWTARQVVRRSDGTSMSIAAPDARFYYAGDGHSHWHIRDFDSYELFDASGTLLRRGEKHGFCFEDNTTYRDWAGSPEHPAAPLEPVYEHETSCGEGRPDALSMVHGLSVGWGDTYPASLPDQGIDVTGLADGTYLVKVTADWQHLYRETNESNNSATAQVRIVGDSVSLLSASDGL